MKPILFPSITTTILGYAAYRITKRQLDSGYFLLSDSTLSLRADPGVAWSDIQAAVNLAASANSSTAQESESPSTISPVAVVAGSPADANLDLADDAIPAEFRDLAKRRPDEYATVVAAFHQAYADGRVVAMKGLVWRHYQIVS